MKKRSDIKACLDENLDGLDVTERMKANLVSALEGGKAVKKKVTFALVFAIVLLIAALGALAAALYPRTAERFAQSYGSEYGDRLSQGDIAQTDASYLLGDVRFTFSDVIWADHILYGTVTAACNEGANALLLSQDALDQDGVNSLMPGGERTYLQAMQQEGKTLLLATCVPQGYVLNGRTMSGDIGYWDDIQEDGSVVTSFEIHGYNGGIDRQSSYTLALDLQLFSISQNGERERMETAVWTLAVTPQINETPQQPQEQPDRSASGASAVPVNMPEGDSGQATVYAVEARDWLSTVQPEWFNQSGATLEEQGINNRYTFRDEDCLLLYPGNLWYYAYEGTETFEYEIQNGEKYVEELPRNETPQQIFDLLSDVRFRGGAENPVPQLATLTLEQAESAAQALLTKLGVEDAVCTWRYGADAAAINALNEARNEQITSGALLNCNPWLDPFTDQDEGYYLRYAAVIDGIEAGEEYFTASLFVNKDGVRSASITAPFRQGEALSTATLLPAKDALQDAIDAAKQSWLPELADNIAHAECITLTYSVKDQAKLLPAWRISATDTVKGSSFDVIVSAIDGAVLNAPWM
ncbi:MAG TPA: hypothetical protein IAC36_00895 [Candidatus Aphodomonas merdavium]|nr:hypothetical protein [Candidatus Aphodomonas merdavium]